MAINYTWDVSNCDVFPTKSSKSNVVHSVHWRLTGIDDTNNDADGNPQSHFIIGVEELDTSDLSNFTNWSSLDAATVQGWVESSLGEDKVTALKQNIDNVIAEKVSPTSNAKILG